MQTLEVRGAPNHYVCDRGVLESLPGRLRENKLTKGIVLRGNKSWQAAEDYFSGLELPLTDVIYNGECTYEEVNRVSDLASKNEADFVLAVGGGKILDIAKAVGDSINLPVILVPTLASNCAAWTPLSVFYDDQGNFLTYKIFTKNTFMVLVEPEIIINSPVEYLKAGIGDTIAKWYEADVLTRPIDPKPIAVEVALHAAKQCRNVLLEEGTNAISALHSKQVNSSFIRVIETIIMAGGMVGSFGDQYGRISGAHSIHNGLTTVPETHQYLHGDKVAYGVLVQLSLEKRFDEIDYLLSYYQELELPVSLIELGIRENVEESIQRIAEAATKDGESIHLMNISNANEVAEGIRLLESHLC
ncbi:iron-containing alcohol dehydrogenase [Ornithinibacillus sp. L9]|uniref:Iron-containing alcohol dehydrogenase n=1 Tax=Ornithinibacillus caprae TaxID=2678566 RepID=A0A6N8FMM2_9BACI|nr:iron-containing alcohol dehydrogenase family protein [Ornithinibacillus caprae]MUK88588.1 iron-containing alcohol dehydrogenase [Ornithinibacillus caprae]